MAKVFKVTPKRIKRTNGTVLALEIVSDLYIRDEYEKRRTVKNLISQNQKIGYLIENLFYEYIKNHNDIKNIHGLY